MCLTPDCSCHLPYCFILPVLYFPLSYPGYISTVSVMHILSVGAPPLIPCSHVHALPLAFLYPTHLHLQSHFSSLKRVQDVYMQPLLKHPSYITEILLPAQLVHLWLGKVYVSSCLWLSFSRGGEYVKALDYDTLNTPVCVQGDSRHGVARGFRTVDNSPRCCQQGLGAISQLI